MEKDVGRIKKNDNTDILIRIDDFGGKIGVTIREYTTSERYTGFTKSGTRIPADSFKDFKKIINSIDESEFSSVGNEQVISNKEIKKEPKKDKKQKTLENEKSDSEEIEEEIF